MSDLRTKSLLLHIQEDLLDIGQFISGATKTDFLGNAMMKKAVCMSLLNIGEAVRSLPEEIFTRNPDISWNSIIGLRNRTAHGYHALDNEIVWNIAKNDIEKLLVVIKTELYICGEDNKR